jgi:uncharacterized protein YyaL (SSP411 family)
MSSNRLENSGSLYLQQHADNPVHWQPWDDQALAQARQENRPILLSIGYSACHWCHVMAHESFEDQATAGLMNKWFVNIKVDREERPDLDKIYQAAFQLMNNQAGGWPLTVFLSPDDLTPFFCGTYFPPQSAYGRPGFPQVLTAVADAWQNRREDILEQNQRIQEALMPAAASIEDRQLDQEPLMRAAHALSKAFHEPHGGFSGAPKFPHPDMLRLCLHNAQELQQPKHRQRAFFMLETTLRHMAFGGVNDLIGGGFYRYSTDDQWMIPHFEKMLYDNGPLLNLYVDLYRYTGNPLYRRVIEENADWLMRDMQLPEGGYAASLDADSEGVEGLYYTWQKDQLEELLDTDEMAFLSEHAGLGGQANFEGRWHLHINAMQQQQEFSQQQLACLRSIQHKLLHARLQRTPPGRDEKVLTAWNALTIKGMAAAYQVLQNEEILASAENSLALIRDKLWQDGRLHAVYQLGVGRFNAYLDDYAFLINALLELLQVRWRSEELQWAVQLAEVMLEQFEDRDNGGFFFTSHDHEDLLQRPKAFSDEAIPSGNGIATQVLLRLGYLLGREDFLQAAERTLKAAWQDIERYPHAHCSLLMALHNYIQPPQTIIIRADQTRLSEWRNELQKTFVLHRQLYAIPAIMTDLPDALAQKKPQGEACAYVCEGVQCLPPITDIQKLARL